MKKLLFPLFLLAGISLACNFGVAAPTTQPTLPLQEQPTQPPPPTQAPTARPTQTPSPTATQIPAYYTETFSTEDFGNYWRYLLMGTNYDQDNGWDFTVADQGVQIDINIPELYVYMWNDRYTYEDAAMRIRFTNMGVNSQNVGLVCRLSDAGWFEFSVGNDGLWYFYIYTDANGFEVLANGGSNRVNMGKATNEYAMLCRGDKVHLYINGEEVKNSPVNISGRYLPEGYLGFNVSSLSVYPVKVLVHEFEILQP